jgi:hypothetical protein
MKLEQKILQALEHRPLSTDELASHLGAEVSTHSLDEALYQLREQKYWIAKHPVISGGCKTCACGITYSWRLTFSGRQQLANNKEQNNAY